METSQNNHPDLENDQIKDNPEKQAADLCQIELRQVKDTLLRLNADFDNYKKRVVKEKANWLLDAQGEVIVSLLPIIDDFDRAMVESKKQEGKDLATWISGFELIHKAFHKFLDKYNIKEINGFIHFDPEFHEAIAQIDSEQESGTIIEIVQRGYTFNDKVLRPAKVIVAK
ncbi:MAG: nucleotide exchange factor GrpE [Candidatus Babeliales bacterium]|nr:nucleotide exchange factor GrpE [Candidatus Babeliales bacterium]